MPSSTTERSTCRRDAPSVRNVASSFVRCAIVIESVLKITKAPTKSAIPETTVKTHVARILMKLDLRDRVQAVVYAYESGLIQPGAAAG